MEFNEKLQELRKQKGFTQEELAQLLFVSRAAVSKWESGRGYPNIDSLKAIASCFCVTVDELLSGDEILTLAEEDRRKKERYMYDVVFGLLDCSMVLFCFLPLFGQKSDEMIRAVSLFSLSGSGSLLKAAYLAAVIAAIAMGILTLVLQNCSHPFWVKHKRWASIALNAVGMLLFVVTLQPYAAVLMFVFLAIKVLMIVKMR